MLIQPMSSFMIASNVKLFIYIHKKNLCIKNVNINGTLFCSKNNNIKLTLTTKLAHLPTPNKLF